MAHFYNPSTLGSQGGRIAWVQELETNVGNITRPCLYNFFFISQAWWCMPVVPATQEAEAEDHLSLGVQAAVSHDQATALQLGPTIVRLHLRKKVHVIYSLSLAMFMSIKVFRTELNCIVNFKSAFSYVPTVHNSKSCFLHVLHLELN